MIRPVFRAVRKKADRVPKSAATTKFEIPDRDEIAHDLTSEAA
jgi:hypothetical protein